MWSGIVAGIKSQVSESTFKTWFSGSYLLEVKKSAGRDVIVVGCKNSFLREQLEARYASMFKDAAATCGIADCDVVFVVSKQEKVQAAVNAPLFSGVPQTYINSVRRVDTLNPNHTFENFVVGSSNNLAHMAFTQAALNIGSLYNPLFVYGKTGVGKTHLLQAFGNYVLSNVIDAKVLYVSAEKFTNDYIESLNNHTQQAFRQKYRSVDVLLVDDIQFLAGKESTQDEFFHTFDELRLSGRQLVIAADQHPRELARIKERLTSRFMGGMTVDISRADLELRVAILRAKCRERDVALSDEIVNYIAASCQTGARELEGFLVQVLATVKLSSGNISLEQIKGAVEKNHVESTKTVTAGNVIGCVSKHFRVSREDLCGPRRMAALVLPRQVLMYLLRNDLGLPLDSIGDLLGGRDHSTVLYGVDKVAKAILADSNKRDEVSRIRSSF